MKYTIATIAAFASVALAKPAFLNTDFSLSEGKPYTIRYSGCDDGCTIVLQNGPSDDLSDYKTLTSSADGDSFTFTPSELPTDTYNFKITDKAGEINYSSQFEYQGSYAAPSVTKSATATKSAVVTSAVTTEEATTLASVTKPATTLEETTTVAKPIIPTHAPSKNATVTPIATPSKTGGAGGETGVPSVPESGAARMTSSLALIAGAVMAMVYLN